MNWISVKLSTVLSFTVKLSIVITPGSVMTTVNPVVTWSISYIASSSVVIVKDPVVWTEPGLVIPVRVNVINLVESAVTPDRSNKEVYVTVEVIGV